MTRYRWPVVLGRCADCDLGTTTAGEYYMVHDHVWGQAWAGRLKPWHVLPGQQYLCIGCLENRLGRKVTPADFTDAPVNDPNFWDKSDRLLDRLGVKP